MASCLCCAVNRRLVLVGLVIDEQSGGHGMTPIDLSTKPGEAQCLTVATAWVGAVLRQAKKVWVN